MRCSWFSRRWVIQELALAREATVHCGLQSVPWQEFADAIGLFALHFDTIRWLFRQSKDDKIFRNYKNFNQMEPLGAKVLVDAITNTFRRSVDETIFEPVSDLETLVSGLSFFESSDPRDTIYALLNIAKDSHHQEIQDPNAIKPPQPNYEKDILEVYTDFLEWVVHSSGSMDILCRYWAIPERDKPGGRKNPTQMMALPSWIQTVDKSPWGFQEQGFNGRINGDSIVGKAGRRRYNASRGRQPEIRFGKRKPVLDNRQMTRTNSAPPNLEINTQIFLKFGLNGAFDREPRIPCLPAKRTSPSHRLYVTGMELSEISWAYGPVARGLITKQCLERGGWTDYGNQMTKVPDKLWRTLVADRNAGGDNPPPWYHRAALHSMTHIDNNGHIPTTELLDHGVSADGKLPHIVAEYLKRVQAVTWNRKFIEGRPTGSSMEPLFGLAPPDAEIGDRICILFGCSVPCILRPCSCESGPKHFLFVGEAYIYGRMDGEAMATLNSVELNAKTTEFVIL